MTISFIIENLVNTDILKKLRDVFKNLCGLDLALVQIDGAPIPIADRPKSCDCDQSPTAARRMYCQDGACSVKEAKIPQDILKRLTTSKSAESFRCASGFRRVVVPIIVNGEVMAFVMTGETATTRLDGVQAQSIISLLQRLIDYMVKNELKFFNDFKGNTTTHHQKIMNRVTRYIWENYHLPELSLEKLSQESGVSYHYLSRLFKKEMKTTFAQYRNKVRLDIARKLLGDYSRTVNQISYECGFEDQGYFSKVFKESFGISPNDYRRKSIPGSAVALAKKTA